MTWPCYPSPGDQAKLKLEQIVRFALGRRTPGWDLVAWNGALCYQNMQHGCHGGLSEPELFVGVCAAHARILLLNVNPDPGDAQATLCLGEINHGGAGRGIPKTAQPPLDAEVVKLLQRSREALERALDELFHTGPKQA